MVDDEQAFILTVREAKIAGDSFEHFFQIVLFESGKIEINYKAVFPRDRTAAGIENHDGTQGISYDLSVTDIQRLSIQYAPTGSETEPEEPTEDIEDIDEPDEDTVEEIENEDPFGFELPEIDDDLAERIGILEEQLDMLIEKSNTKWAVLDEAWKTGIVLLNATDEQQETTLFINDEPVVSKVVQPGADISLLSDYAPAYTDYILKIDNPELILQVTFAYMGT